MELSPDEAFDNMVALITDKIIISHKSTFYQIEQAFVCLLCVVFGYFYIFMACFGNEPVDENYIISNKQIVVETIFGLDMLLTFIVDFERPFDDKRLPVRNLKEIANHYIKGKLIIELIPLLPLQLI